MLKSALRPVVTFARNVATHLRADRSSRGIGIIYVDLGANVGDTIEQFLRVERDATVYGFEPNPQLANRLKRRFYWGKNVTIYGKAAWDADGEMAMYLGHPLSSTLLTGKKRLSDYPEFDIDYSESVTVKTIDFSRWLTETVTLEDTVCVKMDIEGSEYRVLQKLLDSGAIALIDELRCEWHHDRFPIAVEEHARIKRQVLEKIPIVTEWI